ncbi:hypothetical protein BDY19DRAFT_912836 [Irpex rosettiformis]|uniref:Uncharacterized protein n=1 Tax=Irpex rosettiformis TaxID=378272 RepID=A0ACB8UJF8_9APHY|nr:hypothetical protein BDY19DRAFT_912836 [Irpex rosettiformis]
MLKLNWQRTLTLFLPLVIWFIQKWLSRHSTHELVNDTAAGVKAQHRLGSPDSLRIVDGNPDTTAVILNWSRFPNVQRIAVLLCSSSLEKIILEVVVWNNSPQAISYEDFIDTTCPRSKLKIYNSPANLCFQARFLACAQSSSPYCFIQDDDYLVVPEVIQSLHARIRQTQHPHTIHLLPAHEYLTSTLRQTFVHNEMSSKKSIHTGFAWLGHGTVMHRSEAMDFLKLMHQLNASEEEMKMADNYYSILSNRVPEIWFDQGVELGGGQPFTVGTEGDERNNRHILQATKYLESIIFSDPPPAESGLLESLPFVRISEDYNLQTALSVRAACRDARCLLESNIPLLPESLRHSVNSGADMLELEAYNRGLVSSATNRNYLERPPSRAIDNRLDTLFESLGDAKIGEFIQLDYFDDLLVLHPSGGLEMVWLVDINTERILRSSQITTSSAGLTRCARASQVVCKDAQIAGESLRECIAPLQSSDLPHCELGHVARLEVVRSVQPPVPWRVHEVWVRGL